MGKTYLWMKVRDPVLRAKLEPVDGLGCKRPCLNSKYYTALSRANVKVIRSPITSVGEKGITTEDGNTEELDVSH
jgi:cation diffusion facilitator CzcD-associated flavoprotein CzcO